jgi:hypothetical protein
MNANAYAHLYAQQTSPGGVLIANAYRDGKVMGWRLEVAKDAFALVGDMTNSFGSPIFKPLGLDAAGQKTMLYLFCRKVLGKDTPNYPQQIGDCVSFGGKNAAEYLTCLDIVLRGTRETWRPVFPPYYYGTSRVQIGGQHDRQDGSTGAWLAAAVVKYGTLFADEAGVPPYSGQIASDWGYSGPPSQFIPTGQKYLVHSAAIINSWDDLVAGISNGYPCSTASNVGYEMLARSDGFHHRSQPWGHQMCFIGVGFQPEPYAIILNNWGSVHGDLQDFDDQSALPVGILRVRKADAEAHIAAGETFAWSQFDGFPAQDLPAALWKVVGD